MQSDWCASELRAEHRETGTEERPCEDRGRYGSDTATNEEHQGLLTPRTADNHQKLETHAVS